MRYIEKAMGDNEHILYRTHQHFIVLFLRVFASLFAFLVFLAVGLAVLLPNTGEGGNQVRFIIGVIALGSLVMPGYLIVSAWLAGLRGEDLVRRIWRAALAGFAILAFALLLMFSSTTRFTGWAAIVVALVPSVEVFRIVLDWLNERYIITNRRVMEVRGIINKNVRDSALEKVNDVELNQSIVGRVLGYGTVQIITGSDIGVNEFHRISNPVRFKREMLNAKEDYHQAGFDDGDEARASRTVPATSKAAKPGDAEPAKGEIPELIAELDQLRQQGIITEEEFKAKKTDLLARL
ncbi:MAG: PH domain-containing protein [Anaerolineae bacterium]|jgi:hypothetical protein